MTITVSGPDGSTVDFPDGTDTATINGVMTQHFGDGEAPAKTPAAPPAVPVTTNKVVSAAARGVPVVGGVLNKVDAATNALLAPAIEPFMDKGPNSLNDEPGETVPQRFRARFNKSLGILDKSDKEFGEAHPIIDTAAELAGGTAALGGAAKAVPLAADAMGMTGRVVPAALKGAASGAGIGAADALTRGTDPEASAEVGALTGAGGVVAGKALGKVWDAVSRSWKAAPPVPTRTLDVNGIPVPVRESVVTGDPAASQMEQKALHGGMGDEAQTIARGHAEATDAALTRAHEDLAAGLDPEAITPRTTPQAAGESVVTELASAEQQRAAAEAARAAGVGGEGAAIRTDLAPGTPAVDTPRTAAGIVSEALQTTARRAGATRDAAYEAIRNLPGEFNPAVFSRIGQSMRTRLNSGSSPVQVSETLTPHTAAALHDLDSNVGQLRFENQAQGPPTLGPDGRPVAPAITAQTIDEARKRLISMKMDARAAARSSGNQTDVRGITRLIDAFDDHVANAARTPGGFTGNADDLLGGLTRARQLHTDLKRTYSAQNPQDDVGKAMEKIVGKRDVAPAELETVAPMLYGAPASPGGALPVRIAQRIEEIHGRDSRPFNALRQGLLSHMLDTPEGVAPLSNEQMADRIHTFFNGSKGAGLAQRLFTPSERSRMLAHANSLRTLTDPAPAKGVDSLIAKWSGRGEGGERASAKTVVDTLMGESGKNGISPLIVRRLRDRLSERGMVAVKQGVWSRITEDADGAINWGDQKVGQRIVKFLNGDGKGLADELFTAEERKAMMNIAEAHLKNIPVPGTTNPSGSGHLVARLAKGARHSLLPIVGFSHGGVPGAIMGTAIDKAVTAVGNKQAAKKAAKLFYGPQVSQTTPVVAPQRFGALGGQAASGQSR